MEREREGACKRVSERETQRLRLDEVQIGKAQALYATLVHFHFDLDGLRATNLHKHAQTPLW